MSASTCALCPTMYFKNDELGLCVACLTLAWVECVNCKVRIPPINHEEFKGKKHIKCPDPNVILPRDNR